MSGKIERALACLSDKINSKPDAVNIKCIAASSGETNTKKAGYDVSDFDPADLQVGDIATCNFNVTVDGGATHVVTPISGYTFTQTGVNGNTTTFSASWTYQGANNPQVPLQVTSTLPTGETGTIEGSDFVLCSGAGESLSVEFIGAGQEQLIKELCFADKPNVYVDFEGNILEGPFEFKPTTDELIFKKLEGTKTPFTPERLKKRDFCLGYDNGMTAGSSVNYCGERQGLIRFPWEFEVLGWEVNGQDQGVGEQLGPFTSWGDQLQGWTDFFNENDPNYVEGKCEFDFGVLPAPTWRYTKLSCCNPTAKYGALKLRRDDGCLFNVYPVLCSDTITTAIAFSTLDCDGNKEEIWCDIDGNVIPAPEDKECYVPATFPFQDFKHGDIPECTQEVFTICDNGGEGGNTAFVSVHDTCNGVKTITNYTLDSWSTATSPDELEEYDVVGQIVDCATGEPFEFPANLDQQILDKLCKIEEKKTYQLRDLWRYTKPQNGVVAMYWGDPDNGGNAAPHGPVTSMFTDAETHVNGAPDLSGVISGFTTDSNIIQQLDPESPLLAGNTGTDQFIQKAYVICDGNTTYYDSNGNTGETVGVYVGQCGCPPKLVKEVAVNTGGGTPSFLGEFLTPPAGVICITTQVADLSVFGGFALTQSVNGGEQTAVPEDSLYASAPQQYCVPVWVCDDGTIWNIDKTEQITLEATDSWCKTDCHVCPDSSGVSSDVQTLRIEDL